MLPASPQRLSSFVKSNDFAGLEAYIVERYEVIVADDDVTEMLCYLARGYSEGTHGEHYLECRLRRQLRALGYFERMFGEAELFDLHRVWNELHWPWECGFAEPGMNDKVEPQYTRSRLPLAQIALVPVNRVANRVARPPTQPNQLSKFDLPE